MLEVVPGVTVMDVLMKGHAEDVNQIGRTPPLSADKAATHFPRLKRTRPVCGRFVHRNYECGFCWAIFWEQIVVIHVGVFQRVCLCLL